MSDSNISDTLKDTKEVAIEEQKETPVQEVTSTVSEKAPFKYDSLDAFTNVAIENAPKNEEEFFKATSQVFKNIVDCINLFKGRVVSDIEFTEIQQLVQEYPDIINGYKYHNSENKQQLENIINIWNLAILFYFSPEPSNKETVEGLKTWLNDFDPIVPSQDTSDWIPLFRNILRGNIDEATQYLSSLKVCDEGEKLVDQLCDTLNEHEAISNNEKLDDWKKKCADQLERIQRMGESEFEYKEKFVRIYFLLMGNADYIKTTGNFFDQLLGAAHYAKLYASRREITSVAAELDCPKLNNRCSYACAALLLGRIDDALQFCNDNIWMQTHLGHLFHALGTREEPVGTVVDPIYYVADAYAQDIADKYSMWTEAIVYISICVPYRAVWVQKLLESPKAKNIPLLQEVLETVDEYSIHEVKSYIHKTIGQLYEKENDIYNATIEYGDAQDIESLDRIGTDLFNKCLDTGKLQNNVTQHEELRISPIYDSIMKYNDLRDSLKNKEYQDASRLVLDILGSNDLPDEFKSIIFIDADTILSVKDSYYNQQELISLLDIFQAISDSSSNQRCFQQYYQHALGRDFTIDTIIAVLREKMAYRAFTAF